MPPPAWQHPYVNLFKQFGVGQWKKCSKEGDVSSVMVRTNVCVYCFQSFLSPPNSPPSLCMFPQDRKIKCSVYRIAGPIPVNNYILFPTTSTQSLRLTGHFFYLVFRPTPGWFFVMHLDLATEDGLQFEFHSRVFQKVCNVGSAAASLFRD